MGSPVNAPRVLHISLSDYRGGADIAARRIFEAVRASGVDARLVVRDASGDSESVVELPLPGIRRGLVDLSMFIAGRVQKSSNPFHRSLNIIPTGGMSIEGFDPDLIHLHWIGSNTLSLREVQNLPVPVVWTLHDSWPFSGAEHHPSYPQDERFVAGYHRDNRVHSSRIDVDGWIWRRKELTWSRPFHLVAPSGWMAEQARRSQLMGNQPIVTIPNPVDLEAFTSRDRTRERARLGIEPDEFVIVTAGMGGTGIHSKGWPLLRDALRNFASGGVQVRLLMIGQDQIPTDIPIGVDCTVTGVLEEPAEVGRAMSCGDVFVTTSAIESFGLVAAEASAVGLPVIAPRASGLLDVVVDGETGWFFDPGSVESLSATMLEAYRMPKEVLRRGAAGLMRAQRIWSMHEVGRQYRELYEGVLAGGPET